MLTRKEINEKYKKKAEIIFNRRLNGENCISIARDLGFSAQTIRTKIIRIMRLKIDNINELPNIFIQKEIIPCSECGSLFSCDCKYSGFTRIITFADRKPPIMHWCDKFEKFYKRHYK